MFAAPPVVQATIHARLPDGLRLDCAAPWSDARGGVPMHSFLEGPAFDRQGNLYCVDVCHGRIFKIARGGGWDVFASYAGNPNGLKIHRDGRIFVADSSLGLLQFDADSGSSSVVADNAGGKRFHGVNDLVFSSQGDLYFTDPGDSGLEKSDGRVLRMTADGEITVLMDGLPYPNGIALASSQAMLLVAVTRTQQVLRLPLHRGAVRKCGVFAQLSGGIGPDGLALAQDGSLAIAHMGLGTAWVLSALGEPVARIRSTGGLRTTNVAFGGDGNRSLFITEAEQGVILEARLEIAGQPLFSHA